MIKVKFLKDHSVYKTGDNTELEDALGNYLLRCGVVDATPEKKEGKTAAKRETKEYKSGDVETKQAGVYQDGRPIGSRNGHPDPVGEPGPEGVAGKNGPEGDPSGVQVKPKRGRKPKTK